MRSAKQSSVLLLALGILVLCTSGCPAKRPAVRVSGDDLYAIRALTSAGRADEAFEEYERILAEQPGLLGAHRGLVEAAYFTGRLERVAARYRAMIEGESRRGLGHYGLALVSVARGPGHMQAALEHFAAARAAMPQEPDLPYRIGLVYLMDGRLEQAREAFEQALALDPQRPGVRIALGHCLADLGQGKQAIEAMRPIVGAELNPTEAAKALTVASKVYDPQRDMPVELAAEINKATDLLEQDAAQPALTIVKGLAVRFPEAPFVFLMQGLAHSRLGNNGEAVVAFERCLALRPDDPVALVGLGDIYLKLEKWQEARVYYEQAIGLDPFYLEPYQRQREMALRLGDQDRAVRNSLTLVRLQPDQIQPLHDYAQDLIQAGQLATAVGVYESVLALEEGNLVALLRLARLHITLGEQDPPARTRHRDRARELVDQAQELAPDNEGVQELLEGLEEK
jgi:tetratricopeptide (TPR) repeat protein